MNDPMPKSLENVVVMDAEADAEQIASMVDFVFCAVNMKKDEIKALEERYAKLECPVVSNNSAHRGTPDVPMVVPEINPEHILVIDAQRQRLGTKRGFIAVKSNCSLQSYVPALHPLRKYGLESALVCTYQAISGAGKTFETWPEMVDNVIPFIGGEEEKSEQEPMKLWGHVENGQIVNATEPSITAQCLRVPCSDGHMAACFMKFKGEAPSIEQIKADWANYAGRAQELNLPSAPKQFLHYFEEENRPQTRLDRDLEHGMAIAPTRSTIISSSASRTTRCAARRAAPSCWPNCSAPRDISPGSNIYLHHQRNRTICSTGRAVFAELYRKGAIL